MSDRMIHARTPDGTEIVRYDRSGKWYLEADGERVHVQLSDAVRAATKTGTYVYFNEPGGRLFDKRLLAAILAIHDKRTASATANSVRVQDSASRVPVCEVIGDRQAKDLGGSQSEPCAGDS